MATPSSTGQTSSTVHLSSSPPLLDQTQNPTSCYYIHPSGSTGIKFVSVVFDGTGFTDWKRSVTMGLNAKNKICFIYGSLPQPSPNSPDEHAWHRRNNIVIGWLISALDRYIAKSIMYFKNARDTWLDFEGRIGKTSSSQIYSLQERLANTFQEPNRTLATYFNRVKALWDELDDLSPLTMYNCSPATNFFKVQQDQRIMHFLMKLDKQYSQVRTNLLILQDLPSIQDVYCMLLQEECHREMSTNQLPADPMALVVDKRRMNNYGAPLRYSSQDKTKHPSSFKKPS